MPPTAKVVVGAGLAPFLLESDAAYNWCRNPNPYCIYFAALELDGRGESAYEQLFDWFRDIRECDPWCSDPDYHGDFAAWLYWIDDETNIRTNVSRTFYISMGRNIIIEYALRVNATHILFVDSDVLIPSDAVEKLLELDVPIAAGNVLAYQREGSTEFVRGIECRRIVENACMLLVTREVFQNTRWGGDMHHGSVANDDMWYADLCERLGYGRPLMRVDCIAEHSGDHGAGFDTRGYDTTLR